jgi:hypothetical protein
LIAHGLWHGTYASILTTPHFMKINDPIQVVLLILKEIPYMLVKLESTLH